MDQQGTAQTTLRDTVAEAFKEVLPDVPAGATEAPAAKPEAEGVRADAVIGETAEQKAERLRDEKGRFAKQDSAAVPATGATPTEKPSAPASAATAPAAKSAATSAPAPAIQRPSSWKKDYWEAFDKLAAENPAVAQYILQRETEAARGVSAYKAEWDRARPLIQAVEPYRELFQREGLDPGKQFQTYAEIHKGLAYGSEDQKLALVMRLAQDYRVPLEKLFVQQNGQMYFNPNIQPAAPQPQRQAAAFDPQVIERTVQEAIQRERTVSEIASMSNDAQRYPHFEAVRETMAQLLDAKLAADLPGAYDMALHLPQHRELLAAQQEQQRAADEAARKAKAAADAQRARAAAVSPRSATPAGAPAQARKGLRESLAEAVDAVSSSRV